MPYYYHTYLYSNNIIPNLLAQTISNFLKTPELWECWYPLKHPNSKTIYANKTEVNLSYPFRQRSFPAVLINSFSCNQPRADFMDYVYDFNSFTDKYGGYITGNCNIDIAALSTIERDELTDLVQICLKFLSRKELESQGLIINSLSISSENETEWGESPHEYIYQRTITIDFWAAWYIIMQLQGEKLKDIIINKNDYEMRISEDISIELEKDLNKIITKKTLLREYLTEGWEYKEDIGILFDNMELDYISLPYGPIKNSKYTSDYIFNKYLFFEFEEEKQIRNIVTGIVYEVGNDYIIIRNGNNFYEYKNIILSSNFKENELIDKNTILGKTLLLKFGYFKTIKDFSNYINPIILFPYIPVKPLLNLKSLSQEKIVFNLLINKKNNDIKNLKLNILNKDNSIIWTNTISFFDKIDFSQDSPICKDIIINPLYFGLTENYEIEFTWNLPLINLFNIKYLIQVETYKNLSVEILESIK